MSTATTTPIPWHEVFDHPDVAFGTTHSLTRAIEAGRIEAEFQIDKEITDRYQNDRYYDAKKLPSPTQGWVSYSEAKRLLAMGSRFSAETIGAQQVANLLDVGRIDGRITKVLATYDPETELTMEQAAAIIGKSVLVNCLQTGEISKRIGANRANVVSRDDVMAVFDVQQEWMSRGDAARELGITHEAVRRWVQRHNVPTRPAPGLPRSLLVSRAAIEAKAAGRPADETEDIGRLTVEEVAKQYNLPLGAITAAIKKGDLDAKKVDRSWLIDPQDVEEWRKTLLPDLPDGEWLTAPEAAAALKVELAYVYEMCKCGRLPSARKIKGVGGRGAGGKWHIEKSDIDAILHGTPMQQPMSKPRKVAELMPEDFSPTRTVRTNAHPSWELAKSNPNRWVKVDLKEQTVRSEASSKNSSKKDLPGLWSVSKQDNEIFVSYQTKTL